MADDSRLPVLASIGANVAIAITKFIVASITRSTAMLAEAVHSLVNCFDGGLLLLGTARAKRPADARHPFGHGREVYFWSLIVAILFFALGAGFTIYEGIRHVAAPEPLRDPTWNYIVLAFAAIFDGASFVIGFRRFRRRTQGRGYWATIRESKDPTLISVVLEDIADLAGLGLAFLGVFLAHLFHLPMLDGVASIAIGGVIGSVAIILLIETHGLLIGEAARPELLRSIRELASAHTDVAHVEEPLTIHVAPENVAIALRLEFRSGLSAVQVGDGTTGIARHIQQRHPEVKRVMLDVTPLDGDKAGGG